MDSDRCYTGETEELGSFVWTVSSFSLAYLLICLYMGTLINAHLGLVGALLYRHLDADFMQSVVSPSIFQLHGSVSSFDTSKTDSSKNARLGVVRLI